MRYCIVISLFLLTSFTTQAQTRAAGLLDEIATEGHRVATLLEWDSTFTDPLDQALLQLKRDHTGNAGAEELLANWRNHYRDINKHNKSRVRQEFEESIFQWAGALLSFSERDSAWVTDRITRGFPDTYFPVKVLAPGYLTDSSLTVMTRRYPKETLYSLRYLIHADGQTEAEYAAINAPFEARQYLHYSNQVNSLLRTSENPIVQQMLAIYEEYRYNSNSFYLLGPVFRGDMTAQEAHETGKDRESLYNALVVVVLDPNAIGRYSAEEKLSELSDRYVRKLMFQRYLSSSRLSMEQLESLTPDARMYFLFRCQNLLKKKDLQNLALLLHRVQMPVISAEQAAGLPQEWVVALNERFAEEELYDEYAPFLEAGFWATLLPKVPIEQPVYVEEEETVKPAEPEFVFIPYQYSLSPDEKQLVRLENNPYELLRDLSQVTGQLYSRRILMRLAAEHPVEVMAQLAAFADQPYAAEVVQHLALCAPLTAKNYLIKQGHPIHNYLRNSTDSTIQLLYRIDRELGNWTRAYILLDKLESGELTLAQADSICKDRNVLLPYLIDIFIRPDHLGVYTVGKELEYAALDFIRQFNISENTDRSYRSELENLDSRTIYTFLVLGEQEIIGNTFDPMFRRLLSNEGSDLGSFLRSMNYLHVDEFLRLALHYGRSDELFAALSDEAEEALWNVVFRQIGVEEGIEIPDAIDAAEVIMALQDRQRLNRIQDILREEYETRELEKDDQGVAAYGVLASILAQKLKQGWSVYAAPHYRIPSLINIPVHQLFNDQLVNIQQYYFYNDRDGKLSYRNFLRQYEGSSYNWKIEDMGAFVRITSKNGKSVEIYANKPEQGEAGIKTLETWLDQRALEPQVVVHRGLSTHTLKTFRRIPPSARLILDGSCGGFHIQGVALENAPGAHILCNRNIGTMQINDPMFKQISESIREGRDIVWPSFWEDMEARLGANPYFKDYIPPHKNVAALIIKAYYDVLDIPVQ